MRFLSLFSGIEACSVAWKPLGWKCVAVSEIEPFPCFLLHEHYGAARPKYVLDPDEPEITEKERRSRVSKVKSVSNIPESGDLLNLGDVSQITEMDVKNLGPIDLVVFGSPCQNLSVAGKQEGLDGKQSGLFRVAWRVIEWARKNNGCRFVLWENVPGAFSTNKGADFAEVVATMAGFRDLSIPANGWGKEGAALGENGLLEWSVLDAQFFGLAQRRKRLFAVLDTGDWTNRPPILLERESLRGGTPPGRETGGYAPLDIGECSTGSYKGNRLASGNPVAGTILANSGEKHWASNQEAFSGNYHVVTPRGSVSIAENIIGRGFSSGGNGVGATEEVSYTLTTAAPHAVAYKAPVVYGFDSKQHHANAVEEVAPTMTAGGYKEPIGVIVGNIIGRSPANGGHQLGIYAGETSPTLTGADRHAVIYNYVVRRVTPLECERLQGFPDGYTDITHNGKPSSNTARYKALGNSMAVPVMRYIGEQIQSAAGHSAGDLPTVEQTENTMKLIPQSPSSLSTFLTCPKQYEAKYITKEVSFQPTANAIFGRAIHKAIEDYLKFSGPLPTILAPMQSVLDKMTKIMIGAETKLAVDKHGDVVDFYSKSAYQRCIVDAIVGDPKGTIICIDWKTGKKRDAQTQHDFIKKCAKAKYPDATIVTFFIYLFRGGSDRQEYAGQDLVQLDSSMSKLVGAYVSKSFPPKRSGLCGKWCDVMSCPFNGRS